MQVLLKSYSKIKEKQTQLRVCFSEASTGFAVSLWETRE